MAQQTCRRLFVLLVASLIAAVTWLYVGTGCSGTPTVPAEPPTPAEPPPPTYTPTPATADMDKVRRRQTDVRAGSPPNNLPALINNDWKDLVAGDSVRTDRSGEAELQLIGCDGSVYVFDNSTLSVWGCTKEAELNKEYWCVEEGTAAFNISCAARFDVVDTPSAQVNIRGTAFTITYLPERQLSLVTVLRGEAEVVPVLDTGDQILDEPVTVGSGQFLYTMPGERLPEIAEVPAREARPLSELPIVASELDIRPWMDDVTRWVETEDLLESSWPFFEATVQDEPTAEPTPDCAFEPEGEFAALWQTYQSLLGCPVYPVPKTVQDAEQPFDKGRMFWREDELLIYVAYEQGPLAGTFQVFRDDWEEVDDEYSCAATPPLGRLQPKRGFGLVWCKLGGSEAAIGWALEEEVGYWAGKGDPLVQDFDSGAIFRNSAGTETGMAYAFFLDSPNMMTTTIYVPSTFTGTFVLRSY
jgi:hypothetical protein